MTKEQYLESRHPIGTLCHDDIAKNLWVYNGYEWEDTGVTWEQYSNEEIAVQWYTCELTEDVGCGKPLDKRNSTECADCPIYQRKNLTRVESRGYNINRR